MKNPLVSVVVPSFNSGHFLKWTLDSIINQTLTDFECIVVDDFSTDESISSSREIFNDSRFQVIRHKMNVGLSGARNTGLRAARGKYVAFLDSDDLMMPNSLQVRLATCEWGVKRSDRFAGSYCGSKQIEEGCEVAPDSTTQELGFVDFVSSNGLCPFNANQPMIRRDVLRLSGGFSHALRQAEDFDLWQRILRAGYWFSPAKHCSVTYRKRAGSMIRRQPLVHLATSLSIVNSTPAELMGDQLDWSRHRMPKGIFAYSAQKRKIDRIFEFIGMALSTDYAHSQLDLAKLALSEIPDYASLVVPGSEIGPLIHKGVRRQTGELSIEHKDTVSSLSLVLDSAAHVRSREFKTATPMNIVYGDAEKDRLWFSNLQRKYDFVFIPHSAYHVWTISLIEPELSKIGLRFITIDISPEWRDGGVRSAAKELDVALLSLSEFVLGQFCPRAIVVFNDWDPVTRPILVAAKVSGIKTIAIVEGIQDYDDVDVHWTRNAYKTADVVLLPGNFDKKYFEGLTTDTTVTGIPRIHNLRKRERRVWKKNVKPKVLINSNFSYGVLEGHRDSWLTDCVAAAVDLGMQPVISRHPADKGSLFQEFVTNSSFYDALEDCDVSIQRFASGILEALARDVGVIYYNPHGELVDKFQLDPMNSYELSSSPDDLRNNLRNWWELHIRAERYGPAFLDHHAGEYNCEPAKLCAKAISGKLSSSLGVKNLMAFRQALEVLDLETRAFSKLRTDGLALFPDPLYASEKLLLATDKFNAILSDYSIGAQSCAEYRQLAFGTTGSELSEQNSNNRPAPLKHPLSVATVAVGGLQLASLLLLNPAQALARINPGGDLETQAQAVIASGGPSAEHLSKVLDWARAQVQR